MQISSHATQFCFVECLLNRFLTKHNVPEIFKNTSACFILQWSFHQPRVIFSVCVQWSLLHLPARYGKLRTARGRQHVRYIGVVEQVSPRIWHRSFDCSMLLRRITERHHFVRTARIVDATQIRVSVALNEVDVESLQRDHIGMLVIVGVPSDGVAVFVRMDERYR